MIAGIALWFAETALGAFFKGLWARFFPSTDERLGQEETKAAIQEKELDNVQKADRAAIDPAVLARVRKKYQIPD